MAQDTKQLLEEIKQFDTPSITNVVATYPADKEHCLGLYNPWTEDWYTDQSIKCMYPELGRLCGYAVTVTYGMPDPSFGRLGFKDICQAIADSPKPVVLVIKQNLPEKIKNKNGLAGGNMMTAYKSLGVIGVISDGPSRDIDEVRPLGLQYMLTGVCAGHGKFEIQSINTPVSVCGMDVAPGEMIHMDENGAVKFPADRLADVVEKAKSLSEFEAAKQKAFANTTDPEEMGRIMAGIYSK